MIFLFLNRSGPSPPSGSDTLLRLSPDHCSHPIPKIRLSGGNNSPDLTGSECKGWERIHRHIADWRLLAIPAS